METTTTVAMMTTMIAIRQWTLNLVLCLLVYIVIVEAIVWIIQLSKKK